MKEPYVTIGILSDTTVGFKLTGIFSTSDEKVVTGRHSVEIAESGLGILWNGRVYTAIEFSPTSYDGDTFELEGVTIGVDFHWERKENQRFRGSLKLIIDNGKIIAINVVKVEDYLVSVISSEMKDTSSIPLLRAHSVISRSWLLKQMQNKNSASYRKPHHTLSDNEEIIRWWDHEDHSLFDVCADDHCQRYQGIGRVSGSIAAGAVADTRGMVLMLGDELCDARFSKCCGGVFERFESCWDDTPHPYLIPRRDYIEATKYPDLTDEDVARKWIMTSPASFCNSAAPHTLSQVLNKYDLERNDFYRWTQHYSRQQLSTLIESRSGLGIGEVIDLIPL
ncbi:MAG: SpoIID/LytB domain-containing protein, partial [Duncaniella sp.]|nr:SpoIID/LytB domain-containing protein [Duncaniella sp.]